MASKAKYIAVGIGAVMALSAVTAWRSGVFSAGNHQHAAKPQAGCTDHGCGDEANANEPTTPSPVQDDHDHVHGHGRGPAGNLSTEEIEKKTCEHDIRQIDCAECRYELGVVKVEPSVSDALTKTVAVQEGELQRVLRLTGEVQHDQTAVVEVLPPAAGRVVGVRAQLGQRVQAGEVLAVIQSTEFGEAKAAYLEALTAAEIARQEHSRQVAVSGALERILASSREQSAAEVPAEALGEWRSKLVNALARLRQARTVLEREKTLLARQASSQAELETAEREMQTAQGEYAALLEEIQLNVKLDLLKSQTASRLAEARLSAAEQRLHVFGLDHEAIRAIPQLQDNGRFAQVQIAAPRAGIVTACNITEGRFVEPSQCLFTVADTANVWVWCDLYERDLGPLHERLARGDKPQASVTVAAFAEPFAGVVDLLDSAVNESTRTIKVRVQVGNTEGRLRPGMFASVAIPLTDGRKVTLVPRQAVLSDEGRSFAFVHWKDDLWLRRDVTVGQHQGDMVEIRQGLSAGEKVVAGGGFLFKSDVLRAKMGAGCAD